MLEPDLGTTLAIAVTTFILLFTAGIKWTIFF